MQKSEKAHKKSFLRKLVIIVFLPIIVIIWVTGWTLAKIGDRRQCANINKKPLRIDTAFRVNQKESREVDDKAGTTNVPIIA